MEDSEQGIELLKKIFALDRVCCNNCDDSDCRLALIFNYELFSVEACLEISDMTKLETLV